MNEAQLLQFTILGLASWNLLQTHFLTVKIARLEQRLADLPCPNKPCKLEV
jgi:hypothetical protein